MTKLAKTLALLLAGMAGAAGTVAAEGLPGLYDVTGVSSGSRLNVRATPSTTAERIGTLAPGATGIEVVARDATGAWGQVNAGEASGWVALRYLAAQPEVWVPDSVPPGLRCLGTEPFWGLAIGDGAITWSTPEGTRSLPSAAALDAGVPGDPRRALVADGLTATIAPAACSDGMSDRAFGLEALVVLQGGERLLTGCCTIAPSAN